MRTILTTVSLAVILAACGGEEATSAPPQTPAPPPAPTAPSVADTTPAPAPADTTPAPAPAPTLGDKINATMQAMGEALKAHDTDKVGALYTDDAVMKNVGWPDLNGREAISGEWKHRLDGFPDGKSGVRRMFMKDDVAIVEFTFTGTNTGPGPMGGKPTGKAVGVNGLAIYWFNPDGKIKEEHDYMDGSTFMGQLGMAGPKAPKPRELAALPAGPPEVHVAKGTPDEAKNVDMAKAVDKAFETHDEKTFADANDDAIVWDDYTAPAPSNGKKDAVKMFQASAKAFPDMKLSCNAWGFDDYVVQECTMTGTNKGPLVMGPMKMPATNKAVTTHGVDVIQIKDGKAVKGWSYGNGMEWAMQLGLMKAPKMGEGAAKGEAPKGEAKKTDKGAAPKGGETSKAPKK